MLFAGKATPLPAGIETVKALAAETAAGRFSQLKRMATQQDP